MHGIAEILGVDVTLIFAKGMSDFIALGDIVLSTTHESDTKGVTLPLHRQPIHLTSGKHQFSGVTQKVILVENTLILWAGSYVVARAIVHSILRVSDHGKKCISLDKAIVDSGLSPTELSEVSIIYFCINDGRINSQYLDVQTALVGDQTIWTAGTGVWDFVLNTFSELDHISIMARALRHLALEMWTGENYAFLYGGWFEFVIVGENLRFEKVPYALKYWHKNSDGSLRVDLPAIYSSYDRGDLVLASVFPQADNTLATHTNVHQVTSFATGAPNRTIRMPDWNPTYLFHIISRGEDTSVRILIETTDHSFSLKMGHNGPKTMHFSPLFLEKLVKDDFATYQDVIVTKG